MALKIDLVSHNIVQLVKQMIDFHHMQESKSIHMINYAKQNIPMHVFKLVVAKNKKKIAQAKVHLDQQ